MAKLVSRLLGQPSEKRFQSLPFEDWINLISNPMLNTSWGSSPNTEEVIAGLGGAVKANGPVFSLVLARAMVFSEARFLWRRFENGRPQDLFRTQELNILEKPWAAGTTSNLLTRMEFDVSKAGNAYIRRLDGNRLSVMRPDWVTIVIGSNEDADHPNEASDAEIVGFIYEPPNGRRVFLLPDEVAHYAPVPDPNFRFLGMSWITPVLKDVLGDQAQSTHKNTFFENAATPNFIIKFPVGQKRSQIEEYAKLIDERHAGAENAYKTMYLGGGADPVTIGKDFKEMDFAITQGKGESRLASAAGVPPSWVGFSEGLQGSSLNQGNFTAARRRFADGTMRPLWRDAAGSLEAILTPPGGSAALWYDDRDIPFLREDKEVAATVQREEASTITGLVMQGFTPESVVSAVKNSDWDLLEFDERFISVQLQSLEQAEEEAEGRGQRRSRPRRTERKLDD